MVKKKNQVKNIGIEVNQPSQSCDDPRCPFHGTLGVRGALIQGVVTKADMQKTVIIEFERHRKVQKYERYERRRTKIKAHNPPCIDAKPGQLVKIMETRPLSKTKHFVVVEVLGEEAHFEERMELREEGKVHSKESSDKQEEESKSEKPAEEEATVEEESPKEKTEEEEKDQPAEEAEEEKKEDKPEESTEEEKTK